MSRIAQLLLGLLLLIPLVAALPAAAGPAVAAGRIYFQAFTTGNQYDIFSMNPDGSNVVQLTDNLAYDTSVSYTHLDVYKRQFISRATTGSQRDCPLMRTSKRPQPAPRATARSTGTSASGGSRVSACRKSSTSPAAAAAPVFIWRARPRSLGSTASASGAANAAVPSRPVSYTHLDVYKRQPPATPRRSRGRAQRPYRRRPLPRGR